MQSKAVRGKIDHASGAARLSNSVHDRLSEAARRPLFPSNESTSVPSPTVLTGLLRGIPQSPRQATRDTASQARSRVSCKGPLGLASTTDEKK
jgi:hypothetical protein